MRDVLEAEHASGLPLDYLELKGEMIWVEPSSLSALGSRLGRLRLPVRVLTSPLPRHLGCRVVGDRADLPHALTVFRRTCERASGLGVETVVLGSGQARLVPPGFPRQEALRQFRRFVTEAAGICGDRQITLALEPLNSSETNLLNSCAEARAVIEELDGADVRMVVDCYHILSEGLSLASEVDAARGLIAHAHTSARARHCRDMDSAVQAEFISTMRDAGYAGALSIECEFEDFFRDAPPAVDVVRKLVS